MTNADDLGRAIKNGQIIIEVEGDLARWIFKIKMIGPAKWAVCIVGIIAVAGIAISGGMAVAPSMLVGAPVLATTTSILGVNATIAAITIAIAGGGAGVLNTLRDYNMTKISDDKIILQKKSDSRKKK